MSDYISLEELKKLDRKSIDHRWYYQMFPFDMAMCRRCVTMHESGLCDRHEDFTRSAKLLGRNSNMSIPENLEAIYSLRIFYKDLYASNPPEIETLEVAPVEDHVKVG